MVIVWRSAKVVSMDLIHQRAMCPAHSYGSPPKQYKRPTFMLIFSHLFVLTNDLLIVYVDLLNVRNLSERRVFKEKSERA